MVDDSEQTLRERLEQLHVENMAVFSQRDMSPHAQEFFRCHDTAHIVFGCDSSLFGEGVLKIFTIFGTTLGFWKHIFAYTEANAFNLFRQYSWRHNIKNALKMIVSIPRTIIRAKQMNKPWPWANHDEHLDKSIAEIRNEFNIRVVRYN